jgi:hypothetical protein
MESGNETAAFIDSKFQIVTLEPLVNSPPECELENGFCGCVVDNFHEAEKIVA